MFLQSTLLVNGKKAKIHRFLKVFTFTIILLNSCQLISGKKYLRCELARELLNLQFSKTFLSNWICLIEHESERDTRKVTALPSGEKKYGLFQISSKECRDSSSIATTACDMKNKPCCKMTCQNFLNDDISDDAECALKIFNQKGFQHWNGWSNFCRNTLNLPNLGVICNLKSGRQLPSSISSSATFSLGSYQRIFGNYLQYVR